MNLNCNLSGTADETVVEPGAHRMTTLYAPRPETAFDGRAALRLGIVLILLVFGYMKFLPYEAEGVAGIARDYWLFSWLYPLEIGRAHV